jgi:hypothetical protein
MNKINWTQVIVFAVIALLVFMIGASLLSFSGRGWGSGWMMGPDMMGGWGWRPFGWLGMIFMGLFPLGLLALLVLAIVWLVRQVSSPAGSSAGPSQGPAARTCPNCGRPAQADWRNCPYCGQALT